MLVLTRKNRQRIFVGKDIVLEVLTIDRDRVRLGITAPDGVEILREELLPLNDRDRVAALTTPKHPA